MITMMEKQRDQKLTEQDQKEWGAYLRKRNLSPSIDNQHVFFRQHPNDTHDYIIDVKDGSNVLIEVFSK
jgi:hypothetical protein